LSNGRDGYQSLLHYFGEEYLNDNCEACDNCLHPKSQFEGTEAVVNVLETILAVKEKFKADHVANILAGKVTSAIKSYKHHKLEYFGIGEEKDEKFWNMVIRPRYSEMYISLCRSTSGQGWGPPAAIRVEGDAARGNEIFGNEIGRPRLFFPTEPVNGGGDWIIVRPEHWIFADSNVKKGDRIPGLIGWEYHGAPANIPGLEVVAEGTAWQGGEIPQRLAQRYGHHDGHHEPA
jgi:hypothetical protein